MTKNQEKVEKTLVPYFGRSFPKTAFEKALTKTKKGGKIFLVHIIDEAPSRSIRYRTGQIGEESEIVKTVRETQKKIQNKSAKEFAEDAKKKAAKYGISIVPMYVSGDPAQEVLKAVEENSIELVLVKNLRERLFEILHGKEINYLRKKAACKVQEIS